MQAWLIAPVVFDARLEPKSSFFVRAGDYELIDADEELVDILGHFLGPITKDNTLLKRIWSIRQLWVVVADPSTFIKQARAVKVSFEVMRGHARDIVELEALLHVDKIREKRDSVASLVQEMLRLVVDVPRVLILEEVSVDALDRVLLLRLVEINMLFLRLVCYTAF